MNKVIITGAAIILLLVVSFGAFLLFSSMKEKPKKILPPKDITYVHAEEIAYKEMQANVTAAGRVQSRGSVDIISEVSGKILPGNLQLKKGQKFSKGDVLVRIFKDEAQLQLKSKKSRFMNLIANMLPDFKIDFKDQYSTWQQFFSEIKLNKDLPKIPEAKTNKEKIYLASRNITSEYFSIKSDEIRLIKYTIKAPFNGSIVSVMLEPGSVANPGSKLAKVIMTEELELEVPVDIREAAFIKLGQSVKVFSDAKGAWQGSVIRKSNFIDPKTQSLSVFVRLKSTSNNPVLMGQYLKASFSGFKLDSAMEIPRNAVFNTDHVYTVQDGKLQKKAINILKTNDKTILFNGLAEGTNIVIEPLVSASDNKEVEILK